MTVENPVAADSSARSRATATLADPAFAMPPVPDGGPVGGIRWLRRNVARFADGAAHQRRRRQVTDLLAAVDVAALRAQAAERTRAVLDAAGAGPVDLMASVARVVPVELLGAALGMRSVPVDAITVIARAYQPGGGAEEPADDELARLVEALGGTADDVTAARIGLLVQTCDATAGLVGNAALAMLQADPDTPVETVVAETLRRDPPVLATRRLESATGTVVDVDLAAGGLPFGAGPHECPGRDHAVAIATGVVDSVRGCRRTDGAVEYEPSRALRVPARLVVTR